MSSTHRISFEIERISNLSAPDIAAEWQIIFGRPPPRHASHGFLVGNLALNYQVEHLASLDKGSKRRLTKLAAVFDGDGKYQSLRGPGIRPGTRLVREWQGEGHEVIVDDDGFIWRGQHFKSLSAIAREITSTRWSGPAFFGLKNPGRKNSRTKGVSGNE